jgi:hypothetical protein
MTRSRTTFAIALLALAVLAAACGDNLKPAQADAGSVADGPGQLDGGPVSARTMVQRPLFGDSHPQNLFLDPTFSVPSYYSGVGNWMALTQDAAQGYATLQAAPMSDSPAGIAMPVGQLSDATGSSASYQLDLFTQVPGGPGPFHLRVWISTLDASASTSMDGVSIGLLTSLASNLVTVDEDPAQAKVIAGRTWHLFTGEISQNLRLGAFVLFDFPPSANTWLVQAPEFIPTAIDPSSTDKVRRRAARAPRPITAREQALVDRYRLQPKLAVPGGHRALRGDRAPVPHGRR